MPVSHGQVNSYPRRNNVDQNNAVVVNDYFHIHVSKGEKQSKKPVDHPRLAACCETAPAGGASVGG